MVPDLPIRRNGEKIMNVGDVRWVRSSRCGSAACVEVALVDGQVHVRDSKLGNASPVLVFGVEEWSAFLDGVVAGEFDPKRGAP